MRISRFGTFLASLYLLSSAVCVGLALGDTADPKSKFVLLQIPIALQLSLLDSLGLRAWLSSLGWVSAYLLIALPTLVALYLLGSFVGRYFAGAGRFITGGWA